jgi:hypothetical protein
VQSICDKMQYALFVVANSELEVARNNTLFLVVARGVSSELKNLGGKVLQNGGEIYWKHFLAQVQSTRKRKRTGGASSNTLSVVAPLQEAVDTTDRKLEAGLGRTRCSFPSPSIFSVDDLPLGGKEALKYVRSCVARIYALTIFLCQTAVSELTDISTLDDDKPFQVVDLREWCSLGEM